MYTYMYMYVYMYMYTWIFIVIISIIMMSSMPSIIIDNIVIIIIIIIIMMSSMSSTTSAAHPPAPLAWRFACHARLLQFHFKQSAHLFRHTPRLRRSKITSKKGDSGTVEALEVGGAGPRAESCSRVHTSWEITHPPTPHLTPLAALKI